VVVLRNGMNRALWINPFARRRQLNPC